MLQLKESSTKDDIFNKDLWSNYRGIENNYLILINLIKYFQCPSI